MENTVTKIDGNICDEMAESEFQRFATEMDIDIDKDGMSSEDRKTFDDSKNKILVALKKGFLVINDKGEPVYRWGDNSLTFHEPTGADMMAMDRQQASATQKKSFALMAAMTKSNAGIFSSMANRHLKVCQSIVVFFMV